MRLWIHIADVAAHCEPGGALDAEALRRGTSTYVPGAVEPMLPAVLERRRMQPGPRGRAARGHRRDRPRRRRRAAFGRASTAAGSAPTPVSTTTSSTSLRAATRSRRRRSPRRSRSPAVPPRRSPRAARRGSLEVESFEPEFEFDRDGAVVGARSVPSQTEAHRLIEHLMILTNEQVAEHLRAAPRPDPLPGPRAARPAAGRAPRRAARGARPADAAAARAALPERRPASSPARSAALVAREAERRGHGRDAYTSLVLRSLQAGLLQRSQPRPCRARQLAPTRTSPRRSAAIRTWSLTARCSRRSARERTEPRRRPGPRGRAGAARSASARRSPIERDADRVCGAFLLERELFESGWKRASRARSRG